MYVYILVIVSSSENESTHLSKEAMLDSGMKAVPKVLVRKSWLYFLNNQKRYIRS